MKNPIFIKGLLIALAIIVMDQASKYYLVNILNLETGGRINVLPFFNLVLVWNKGISFGMFNHFAYAQIFFSVVALFILIFLCIWLYKNSDPLITLALGLLIGGAGGNIIDRIYFGGVVDFLDFHLQNYHWPAFNIADSSVCIGAIILVLHGLFDKKPALKTN